MRKNTLIKLLAVLVLCFAFGAALVSCGGETEEPAVKTIVGVQFVGNELIITYDDGTKVPTAIPEAAVCQHQSIAKHTLAEHTGESNGTYLEVCNDCGYSWIKYEQRHNWGDDVVVESTCLAGGYTTNICATCGIISDKKDEKDPIDHVYTNGVVEVEEGKNLCVDGGIVYCIYECGTTAPVEAKADEGIDKQHTVATWDFTTNAPTLTVAGVATGVCANCGETVNYTLPAFLNADGTYNTTAYDVADNDASRTSCSQALTATFTLKANAAIAYADVVVVEAGAYHMLKNKDGVLKTLAPSDVNANGYSMIEFPGIKEFADSEIVGCQPQLAYYVCDDCGAVVDIYAYDEHDWQLVNTDTIVCGTEAFEHYVCKDDPAHTWDKSIGTRQHDKEYTGLTNTSGAAFNAFSYVITCKHTGCPLNEVVELTEADVTIDKTTTVVTCENDGKWYASYTVPETSVVLKAEYTIEKKGHVLNGKQMTPAVTGGDAPTAEDVIYKYYEGCGVTIFADKNINDGPVLGYFECDHKVGTESHRVPVWVALDGTVEIPAPAAE